MRKIIGLLLIIGLLSLPSAAIAAKPSVDVDGDFVYGGYVQVTTTMKEPNKPYTYLLARVEVYQDGQLVQRTYSLFDGGVSNVIPLGSTQLWQGGAADAEVSVGWFDGTFKAKVTELVQITG